MEPKQDIPGPTGNNPEPQIIKPNATPGLNDTPPPTPQPPQAADLVPPQSVPTPQPIANPNPSPEPQPPLPPPSPLSPEPSEPVSVSNPTNNISDVTPASSSPEPPLVFRPPEPSSQPSAAPQPLSPPQPPQQGVDTNKLFQADSGLPNMNTNQGNFVVDNRPPGRFKRIFKSKKIMALLAAQLIAILLVVGGVFGYYLPNRPGAVWNTGLDRSGQALDKLLTQATDKQQLQAFKKSQVNASLNIKSSEVSFKGDFTGRFDQSKADGNLDVTVDEGGQSAKLAMKYISILADGATYPDFYAQFNGIKDLGGDAFVPGISQYDGKWISMDSNYFESLGYPVLAPGQKKGGNGISSDDVSELIRAVSSVSKDYILTSNKNRAIIKEVRFVGKEKTDGISTYHYIATIDKNHGKDYCKALYEKVSTTNIYKKANGNDQAKIDKSKADDIKACQDYDINIKGNGGDFDIWIDAKYKLIHKIRLPDDTNTQAYTDIGQTYTGGDDVSLFVNYHDGKEPLDINTTFSTNIKSIDSKGELTVKGGKGNNTYSGSATLEIKPLSGDINIQKPANAIPLQDILKKYGLDPKSASSSGAAAGSGNQLVISKNDLGSIGKYVSPGAIISALGITN